MARKNAFISFDHDHDGFLRTALAGQAKHPDSPFDIIDRSVKEPLTGNWKEKVKGRIGRADVVIVICGQHTHTASGVAVELQIAKDLRTPYFLLRGYSDKVCTRPTSASTYETMHDWTWDNLKKLIG